MAVDELLTLMRSVFPTLRLQPDDIIEHSCEECADLARTFAHQTWLEMSAEAIDAHFHSLPLFSPAAFQQFLPAYMTRGLQRQDDPWGTNDVLEFTTYSLLPDEVDAWWLEHVGRFTEKQAVVIKGFLDQVQARGGEYLGAAPRESLEYWEIRAAGRRTTGCS